MCCVTPPSLCLSEVKVLTVFVIQYLLSYFPKISFCFIVYISYELLGVPSSKNFYLNEYRVNFIQIILNTFYHRHFLWHITQYSLKLTQIWFLFSDIAVQVFGFWLFSKQQLRIFFFNFYVFRKLVWSYHFKVIGKQITNSRLVLEYLRNFLKNHNSYSSPKKFPHICLIQRFVQLIFFLDYLLCLS